MDTPDAIRRRIIQLSRENVSQREISRRLIVPQSTISGILKRFRANKDFDSRRKGRCGRKAALTRKEQAMLRWASVKNPVFSARQLQSSVAGTCSTLSLRCIQKYLKKLGRIAYRPLKCPTWTVKQRRDRQAWCKERLDLTAQDWKKVVFSDETYLHLDGSKPTYVRKGKYERTQTIHCVQHKPFLKKLMVWGSITSEGPGPITVVKGTMTSERYMDVLQEHIVPFQDEVSIFQQDNAPCHKSSAVTKFLAENQLSVLPWPSRSPDLNPIENIWALLKQKVMLQNPTNLTELHQSIISVWYGDLEIKDACQSCYRTMPNRIRACFRVRGGYIPY